MNERKIKHFFLDRLSLWADSEEGRIKLAWGMRDGYPRATVYVYRDKELVKSVPCNTDIVTMKAFLGKVQTAIKPAKPEEEHQVELESFNHRYQESTGRKDGELYKTSTMVVKSGGNKPVTITVRDEDKGGEYTFTFSLSKYHSIAVDGMVYTGDSFLTSMLVAKTYFAILSTEINNLFHDTNVMVNGEYIREKDTETGDTKQNAGDKVVNLF